MVITVRLSLKFITTLFVVARTWDIIIMITIGLIKFEKLGYFSLMVDVARSIVESAKIAVRIASLILERLESSRQVILYQK